MKVKASAPSNIALIKYMGKTNETNLPSNSSLSYTLEHLRTFVEIESTQHNDSWEALPGLEPITLNETGLKKFLAHFDRLKNLWEVPGHFLIRSANNFPADCGLASSASSFAALTKATYELARTVRPQLQVSDAELSRLSRMGSGSSCRSFFSPWAVWSAEGAKPVEINLELEHAVVIVAGGAKSVSSSQAHKRVPSSLLFSGRTQRAEQRLVKLEASLANKEWQECFEICWTEFWDMHALFETSQPAFGYMTPGSIEVLARMRGIWQTSGDGPLVTMDAGANVHLLLRKDQVSKARVWLGGLNALTSWPRQ